MEQLATLDDLPKRYLGQLEESNLVPLYQVYVTYYLRINRCRRP